MEEHSSAQQGQVAIQLESTSLSVAPGNSVTVPISLHSQSSVDEFFELSVQGIPSNWVSVPSPVIRLAPGEQREVLMTIQPPLAPPGRAGRHSFVIRVASQGAPEKGSEVTGTLTVAALEVPGRIGILLASTEFPVVPGEGIGVPIVLLNHGLEGDIFALAVDGIPSAWVYTPAASVRLAPGQQQEVSLTIQPPRSLQTRPGRYPFKIQAMSQAAPGQMAEAECTLTIATYTEFSGELRPERVAAGEPARVMVENQGNIQQAFTLTCQSPDDALIFEPAPSQELRVPPGEVSTAEFSAKPRSRPFYGGEVTYPFTTRVQSAGLETQNLRGEVVSRALIPTWVLPVALALIVILACCWAVVLFSGGSPEAAPTSPPEATQAPTAEVPPEQPTEPPPEVPTEPPPEQPTEPPPEVPTEPPPEQPTEPPPEVPTEPPPEQQPTEPPEQPPTEPPPEGGLPCTPLAFGLILAPLLVIGKKGRRSMDPG